MMSGRIRTIKPEMLEDERVAALSDRAYRLFIGCIQLADDYGNLHGAVAKLRAAIFWGHAETTEQEVAAALVELVGIVEPYRVRGQSYLRIVNWAKHQRVVHPGKPRVPGLDQADPAVVSSPPHPPSILRQDQTKDPDPDPDPDLGKERDSHESLTRLARAPRTPSAVQQSLADFAERPKAPDTAASEVLARLNAARKRVIPRCRDLRPTPANLEQIAARLKEGHSLEDFDHVLGAWEIECLSDRKPGAFDPTEHFNAGTPFKAQNFARKLGRPVDQAQLDRLRSRAAGDRARAAAWDGDDE